MADLVRGPNPAFLYDARQPGETFSDVVERLIADRRPAAAPADGRPLTALTPAEVLQSALDDSTTDQRANEMWCAELAGRVLDAAHADVVEPDAEDDGVEWWEGPNDFYVTRDATGRGAPTYTVSGRPVSASGLHSVIRAAAAALARPTGHAAPAFTQSELGQVVDDLRRQAGRVRVRDDDEAAKYRRDALLEAAQTVASLAAATIASRGEVPR